MPDIIKIFFVFDDFINPFVGNLYDADPVHSISRLIWVVFSNLKNIFMKSSVKMPALLGLMIATAFISPKPKIVGHWKIFGPPDMEINEYVDLKKDGSYDVYVNGKVEERGFYNVKNSVFSIKNAKPVCGDNYWGKYKIDFYGSDSIHFTLIEDSCSDRRRDIVEVNPGLRRIKEK